MAPSASADGFGLSPNEVDAHHRSSEEVIFTLREGVPTKGLRFFLIFYTTPEMRCDAITISCDAVHSRASSFTSRLTGKTIPAVLGKGNKKTLVCTRPTCRYSEEPWKKGRRERNWKKRKQKVK